VLKYPDGGFLFLMVFAMGAEGWVLGFILPRIFSDPHGILFSLVSALVFVVAIVIGAYYIAEGVAWLLARLFRPQL
jgi:hypothetical protein